MFVTNCSLPWLVTVKAKGFGNTLNENQYYI